MNIYNLGSLNLDRVYSVPSFVRPGETIMSENCTVFCGGKGLNQSVALARAGAHVYHIGIIGHDGSQLRTMLLEAGVDTTYLNEVEGDSGHAIIQVVPSGQNCIIVSAGTNRIITENYIQNALMSMQRGDIFLTQNETSGVAFAIKAAHEKGVKVVLNPSPVTEELYKYPLDLVDIFILNEVEGTQLTGCNGTYTELLSSLVDRFPNAAIVLTVGKDGAYYAKGDTILYQQAISVKPVDTTAAGDTFCGYFLASLSKGFSERKALIHATRAAAIVVGRRGAAPSIPSWTEMLSWDETR